MTEVLMTANNIKVYFLRHGFKSYLGEIANTLVDKQKYVGGYIEVISIDGVIDLICNEEGKLLHLPVNRAFVDDNGEVLDVIVGDILVVRHNDEGDFVDVHENDLETIIKHLRPCQIIGERGGYTVVRIMPEEELEVWKDEK